MLTDSSTWTMLLVQQSVLNQRGARMNYLLRFAVASIVLLFAIPTHSAAPGGTQYTLTSGTDYTYVGAGKPVGCPQCKDLFFSTKPLSSPAGTTITSIVVTSRSPTKNNHWYRCQREVDCATEEFSDVNVHNKSCIGTPACTVWRATDGRVGSEQDVIDVRWQ
jgi:hypothetical protein